MNTPRFACAARFLVPGSTRGPLVVFDTPLSLWGGLDAATGRITDVHHPGHNQEVRDCILGLPGGRGSSSSSYILVEAVRQGTAPRALVLAEADPILALGAVVARELYGTVIPVAVVEPQDYAQLLAWSHTTGVQAEVDPAFGVRVFATSHEPNGAVP